MRLATSDIKNNGNSRTAFSYLNSRHFKTTTDTEAFFSFFLPTFHVLQTSFGYPNFAHLR